MSDGVVYELLRVRTRDADETTVYLHLDGSIRLVPRSELGAEPAGDPA